jgi:hypothetical protein
MTSNFDIDLMDRYSELNAVLQSKEFSRSPALARLLKYLCEKAFQGKTHEIKEFSIATEVYGKDQSFGEKRDSLVRVEVSRLRRRLQRYYETEGAAHAIRIVIKAGAYRPEFERITDSADPGEPEVSANPELAEKQEASPADRVIPRPRWAAYAAIAASALIVVAVVAGRSRVVEKSIAPSAKRPEVPAVAPMAAGGTSAIRILAGSPTERSVDRFGVEWLGDRYFIGGEQNKWGFGGQERLAPRAVVRGAPDQMQFRSFRYGAFSYRIPLAPGSYELRLYFSEVILRPTDSGEGVENRRIFDVLTNGRPLLSSFDIAADAGDVDTADIRVFENISPAADGFLTLDFRPIREAAWLNAIEVIPNSTGRAFPIRIVSRNANYTDRKGQLWGIDRYFIGGRQTSDGVIVEAGQDPELFEWQRYGHFSYHFPVPPGRYRLRLLFAETFFGPTNRGKGGVGSRVFNVYCSGVALLRQFDIFKEAGGSRGIEKVFHGITPSPQGRIDVSFEPLVQYAVVQAIELAAEDK